MTPEIAAEKRKTDDAGVVKFDTVPGLVGFLVSVKQPNESGTFEGEEYNNAMSFATLTLRFGAAPKRDVTKKEQQPPGLEDAASVLPVLPKPIASFGAVVNDGWVYVYGGHTGRAHAHSRDNLVDQFIRVSCADPSKWEELPTETPVQGVPLVAHNGKIYRLGGLVARNAPSESDDLHSLTETSCYDPETNQWQAIAPLPRGRSSHDAVVLGDNVYIVGGWSLAGDGSDGEWHDTMLIGDLSQEKVTWQSVPQPFERRALAVGNYHGKVAVVGGLDTDGDINRSLHFYDPKTSSWSDGPSLPGEGMNGFGVSAWSLSGEMFVSGVDGNVYQLNGDHWDVAAKLQEPRFFHQLVPESATSLFAIGGANDGGHIRSTERIELTTVR